jgi:CRP/FNR family transcriptional regulator
MSLATLASAPVSNHLAHTHMPAANAPLLPLQAQCSACHLRELCLPRNLEHSEVARLDSLMFFRRSVKAAQVLFHEGDAFQFVYAVRSDTFKSTLTLADGREQVSGFHIAGELMGLDGVGDGRYASSATALEDTVVCAIPYERLIKLTQSNLNMQSAVNRMMSREIVREHSLMLLLGSMNAEERLAAFLLNMSQRLKARGYSASEFNLRMTREEIGSYLGLKLETISRTFSSFQRRRLLDVEKRHIRIVDVAGLLRLCQMRLH